MNSIRLMLDAFHAAVAFSIAGEGLQIPPEEGATDEDGRDHGDDFQEQVLGAIFGDYVSRRRPMIA